MSSSSAMDLDPRVEARAQSSEATATIVAAAVFALGVAVVDLLTYHVNLPIIFIVPLLLIERANSRRLLWQAAAVLVVLTYAGYFLGKHPGVDSSPELVGARMVNRTIAVITLLATAAALHTGIAMRERAGRLRRIWPHDPDGLSYERVVLSIDRVLAPLLGSILVLALFVSDAVSDPRYNIAMLYVLPLIILARTRSAALVWGGLPILIAAVLLGLFIGPPLGREHLANMALNRVLVCFAILAAAVIVHLRLRDTPRA